MVKNNPMHNISFKNGRYIVYKTINNKTNYYGFYRNKQTAIDIRDYIEENNWQIENGTKTIQINNTQYNIRVDNNKIKLGQVDMRNIFITKSGNYIITHGKNKQQNNYKVYHTIEEAISMRDWLIEHDWDHELFIKEYEKRYPLQSQKYINIHRGKYRVTKSWGDVVRHYGSYNTLQEAKNRRDYLIKHDWKTVNNRVITEHDGVWYVRKNSNVNRKPVKKFYFKTDTKEEAILKSEEYRLNSYPEPFLITNKYRYIHHNGDKYYIIKPREKRHGYAFTLKEAVIFRTIIEEYNWNKPPEGYYEYDGALYEVKYNTYGYPSFQKTGS